MRRALRPGTQLGASLVEVLLSTVIGITALSAAISLTRTTTQLVRASHVESRVHAEHRRSLLAIGNVLRSAALDSLQGFTGGVAYEPVFQRAVGVTWHERVLGDPERLEWRASSLYAPGVVAPGGVWLVGPDGERLLADRVPAGGFSVVQEGNVLAIRVTTYYASGAEPTALVSSETAVSLRN